MNTIGLNFVDFKTEYRPLINSAVDLMEKVLWSPEFFQMLSDEIANSNNLEGELSAWKFATPETIFKQLFPITLHLSTYYTYAKVIGYGYPNTKDIFLNTKYLNEYTTDSLEDLMEIGSNLLHEHSHDLGFHHDYRNTRRRPNSISYVLNRAYEKAFRLVFNLPKPVVTYTPWYSRLWSKIWN